jgi:tRNA U34 2-thiouridine synthase MnmA/TrmU
LSPKKRRKALALLSGGLDSTLAIKLMLDQGVMVEAISFVSPFCTCSDGSGCAAVGAASRLGVKLKLVSLGEEYLEVVKNPKYGYGKNMNPCVDCRIFMLKKARKYADETGADFLITGEVLGQRPKSQHLNAMTLIEREAGLQGKLLRPLSAKLLAETEVEQRSWVERELLLDIQGRSRRRQIDLAEALGVIDYPCPAGGCLLTDPIFCTRLKDLITHEESLDLKSISLLKVGRQFRYGPNKIIVGRNQEENRRLMELKSPEDLYLEVPEYGSPITLLLGPENEEAIRVAASITARYSDAPQKKIEVKYGRKNLDISIIVSPSQDRDMAKMRVE